MRPSTNIDGDFATLTSKRVALVIYALLGFLAADVASVIIMLYWL